jgi:RNA polymerase sigma factor (sigma-70 family)
VPGAALTEALRGFVRGRLGDHPDGDDVVQETYARLFSYQERAAVGNLKGLCFAIARNLMLDLHRGERRGAAVPLDEEIVCPQPTPERVVAYRRAVAILAGALERMPPLRREVFLRRRLDGLATAEIADALGMSLAAVEKHVVRAFRDLRDALGRRGFTMEEGA